MQELTVDLLRVCNSGLQLLLAEVAKDAIEAYSQHFYWRDCYLQTTSEGQITLTFVDVVDRQTEAARNRDLLYLTPAEGAARIRLGDSLAEACIDDIHLYPYLMGEERIGGPESLWYNSPSLKLCMSRIQQGLSFLDLRGMGLRLAISGELKKGGVV